MYFNTVSVPLDLPRGRIHALVVILTLVAFLIPTLQNKSIFYSFGADYEKGLQNDGESTTFRSFLHDGLAKSENLIEPMDNILFRSPRLRRNTLVRNKAVVSSCWATKRNFKTIS